jgi:hypothetical protein
MFYLTEKDRPGPWGIATDRSWERRLNSLPNTGTTKIKNQKTYYESNSYIDAMMIHNHPSGDPTPSPADIQMTQAVHDIAKPLGIALHDHIIVGKEGHASLKGMRLI